MSTMIGLTTDGTRHGVELHAKLYAMVDWLDVGTHADAWQRAYAGLLGGTYDRHRRARPHVAWEAQHY